MNNMIPINAKVATAKGYIDQVDASAGALECCGVDIIPDDVRAFLQELYDPKQVAAELRWLAEVIETNHSQFAHELTDDDPEFLEDGSAPNPTEPDFIEMTTADEVDIRGKAA